MSDQQFYNDNEAEEILRIANRESLSGGMTKEKLIQTAAELGISPEAVERAEQQLVLKRETDRVAQEDELLRQQFKKERRASFFNDLLSYIGTNAFMVGIWWFTGHGYFWPMWVMLAWGIGIASDFASTYLANDNAKFERWKRRRERRALGRNDISDRSFPVLDELVAGGEISKVDAIRELRDRLSLDSRDAKDAADKYESENPGVFT
jgi:hypothetical protein